MLLGMPTWTELLRKSSYAKMAGKLNVIFYSNYSLLTRDSGVADIRDIDLAWKGEMREREKKPQENRRGGEGALYTLNIGDGLVHPPIFSIDRSPIPHLLDCTIDLPFITLQ